MKSRLHAVAAVLIALVLGACTAPATPSISAAPQHTPASSHSASAQPSAITYPRTVKVGDTTVTIPKEAKHVVALSNDVADVVLSLGAGDRLAALPSLNARPEMSIYADAAKKVPGQLDHYAFRDAEKLLALNPDLVLISSREDTTTGSLKQLSDAGIPVVVIKTGWETLAEYTHNVRTIAQTLGLDAKGEQVIQDTTERWNKVTSALKDVSSKPVTAVIRILGPHTWMNGPGTIGYTVTKAAGATCASDAAGLKASTKFETEQLVKTNPAVIVVVDSSGKGKAQYDKILNDPALASVDAVKNGKVLVLTTGELSSGIAGVVGLEKLAKYLHPDKVK